MSIPCLKLITKENAKFSVIVYCFLFPLIKVTRFWCSTTSSFSNRQRARQVNHTGFILRENEIAVVILLRIFVRMAPARPRSSADLVFFAIASSSLLTKS